MERGRHQNFRSGEKTSVLVQLPELKRTWRLVGIQAGVGSDWMGLEETEEDLETPSSAALQC